MELDAAFFSVAIPAVLFAAVSKGGFGGGAGFVADCVRVDARGGLLARAGRAEPEFAALFASGIAAVLPALRKDPRVLALQAGLLEPPLCERRRYVGGNLSLLLRSLPFLEGR